jgi:3-deoxy-D-manno-octulosonate 8-phosphate phosphatase (KDO 8-P phosphatase)
VIQNPNVRARAAKIKLLLMDVDGVLTNGKLYHFPDEEGNMIETKGFDSQDGIALQWMQWKGLRTGVISGRESLGTAERARQVKMNYVYQGHIEKVPILEQIMTDGDFTADEVAYMGDDFTDLVVMRRVGFAIAVANARPEVKREAHYVTEATGGNGAVREVIELILDAWGFWAEILEKYEVRKFANR